MLNPNAAWARAPAPWGNSAAFRGLKTVPWTESQQWKGAPFGRAGAPACAPDGKAVRPRIPHAAKDTGLPAVPELAAVFLCELGSLEAGDASRAEGRVASVFAARAGSRRREVSESRGGGSPPP